MPKQKPDLFEFVAAIMAESGTGGRRSCGARLWLWKLSDAFRHQDGALYLALNSHFTDMKTIESGLAYTNSVGSDPRLKLLYYYADHVPDIAALVTLANSVATGIPQLEDDSLLD